MHVNDHHILYTTFLRTPLNFVHVYATMLLSQVEYYFWFITR